MKKIRQFRKLRKGWKIFIAAMLMVVAFGGIMMYVNADTSITLKLSVKSIAVSQGASSGNKVIVSQLTGNDDNVIDSDPELNNKPNPNNIEWTCSNTSIARFLVSNTDSPYGDGTFDTYNGTTPEIKGIHAGMADVTATYYSKTYGEGGVITSSTPITSAYLKVYVPISISITDSYANTPSSTLYKMGDQIVVTANTTDDNKLFVETGNDHSGTLSDDGVVKLVSSTASSATLQVIGGGTTTVTVRTQDGDGVTELSRTFVVRGEVKFDETKANAQNHQISTLADGTKYMILSNKDYEEFSYEDIPSNVKYPSKSGVLYRTSNSDVAKVKTGMVCGNYAGVSTVTAGLVTLDTLGNESWYTKDTVDIVVPFKKLGNEVSNMNVGDQLQLSTSSNPSEVTWTTTDNSILQVDSTTGLVTAMKAGTAKIYATRVQDDLYTKYKLPYQLVYEITVIDGFGLSTTNTTVNIGSSFELKALVTNDIEKYPVTFTVTNQAGADGVVPTETLVSTTQSGAVLTVTGVAPGTVHITARQNVNGVVKSETCVVYVTTPVGEVSINPSSLQIDRGSSDTVQLLFNPSGPTNNKVMWSYSNPSVATVEGDSYTATIKGISGGSATITVITEDGLKVATCDVYVREPVTGITLNATTVESSMAVGKYQLVATIFPAGEGVNRNVTWSSSDTSVCTVDENGLVKYVKPGYCTIVCKTEDGAFLATCNFIISIPVETIKLDYTDEIMSIGKTLRITAEVLPITATNRTVSWESSNTNVCIVDSNGLVEAVGTGSCTILCKSLDGGVTAMCNIYVKQPVTQVVLNTTDITVRKGQTFWLNATCLPENADNKIISWESRDENVCTVESDGKVTATGAGTTSIIATNVDTGLTAYCVVTVTQPVTGITLNSNYQLLWVGAKYAIIPNVEPIDAENKKVTYLSSDPSVASVDENGVVTALKGGSCIIEVTTDECKLTAACTIEVKEYVSTITLSETNKFLNVGATGTLKATVGTDTATNKNVIWSSSNNDICSVDDKGNLTAVTPGTAIITATAADGSGVSASCVVRVVNPVTGIRIEPDTVRLLVGESQIVTAVVTPDNASIKDVDWVSSNESIATVDEAGEIFALSTGKCKITAISKDGNEVKGVCWVYVTPVINISSLKINSSEIYMLSGKSRQLTVRVRPATNTDSYEWYSTDTGVVVVDNNGVITTVGPGTAQVVVESNNNGVSSTCTVHSLGISHSNITLEQYDKYNLDVIGNDNNSKVTWRSSNPRVCTVSSSGEIVARRAGTTTVTAVVNNKTLTCVVRVTNFR